MTEAYSKLTALSYAQRIELPDERVAVCGDWHGDGAWVSILARALPTLAPDITTILQLGDWWMNPAATDEAFAGTAIDRIYVVVGNHENFGEVTPLLEAEPGAAVQVSSTTWLLPRPGRLIIGGRTVLAWAARHPSTRRGAARASTGGRMRTSPMSMFVRQSRSETRT